MALQPKRMLSFDWNAPPQPAARRARSGRSSSCASSRVGDKQTRVTLHHTGWGDGGEWDKAYAYFDRAWGNVLANLKKRFDQGPFDWTDWLEPAAQDARTGGAEEVVRAHGRWIKTSG